LPERDLSKALGGVDAAVVSSAAGTLVESGVLCRLPDGTLVHRDAVAESASVIHLELERHQREHPIRWGIAKGELKSRLARPVPAGLFDALLAKETAAGRLHQRGDRVRTGGADSALSPEAARFREKVEALLLAHPFAPPSPKEMIASAPGLAPDDLTEMLQLLVFEGRATRITSDLYYHAGALGDLEQRLRAFFGSNEELTVGGFKDLFGVSRKHAVPLLEHADRAGLTRRRGDVRIAGPHLEPS
jgi:selenocysteine-specific elongation factor